MKLLNLKIDTTSWEFDNNKNSLNIYFYYCGKNDYVTIEFREIFYKISRLIKKNNLSLTEINEIENYIYQLVNDTKQKILEKIDKKDCSLVGNYYHELELLVKSIILSNLIWF
jgi:hypothetical protein